MKTRRKVAPRPMAAQVISLEAYRRARSAHEAASFGRYSVMDAYCSWIALAGAVWSFWW